MTKTSAVGCWKSMEALPGETLLLKNLFNHFSSRHQVAFPGRQCGLSLVLSKLARHCAKSINWSLGGKY